MHLHAQAGDFQAHLGTVAFDQWHHKFIKRCVLFAHVCIRVVVRCVIRGGSACSHGAAALYVGAHGHQHALHIGVVDDGRASGNRAIYRAALHTVFGVQHGFLIGALGHCNALHAHGVAGGVHHDEHVFQATVFLADQVTHSAAMVAVLQHRCGRCLDAHFVFNAHAVHVVART